MLEGGTSGIFKFVVKSNIPGFNWPFLTILDFAIIIHLNNYLPCLVWWQYFKHNLRCVTVQLFFFIIIILTYCIYTMDLKLQKQKNRKSK